MTAHSDNSVVQGERLLVVSSDCHAGPPVRAYQSYVDPRFRDVFEDYASQVESHQARTGNPLVAVGMAQTDDTRASMQAERDATAGLWDPAARIIDLDADGVAAEVVFPQGSVPFHKYPPLATRTDDVDIKAGVDVQAAGCRAYNRWLADLCAVEPERHVGVAVVPIRDIERSVAEVVWARDHGLRGVSLPPVRIGDDPEFPMYHERIYEAFWAACESLGMPLHAHGLSSISYGGPESGALVFAECDFFARRALWFLIFSGVFERYPKLQLVFTEQRAGWVKPTLDLLDSIIPMDDSGSSLTDINARLKLPRRPSEYFGTNCWVGASFLSHHEVEQRDSIGVDRIMWGSDYPHSEGTWPWSVLSMRRAFEGVAARDIRRMAGWNAVGCYGLDADVLTEVASRIGPSMSEVRTPLTEVPERGKLTWAFRSTSGWS